jgi:uncharacterized protein
MNHQVNPIAPGQRIELLDVLRGFAIFGILMVNMAWMNAPVAIAFTDFNLWDGISNRLAEAFIRFFFESKFFVLFSMLFGYGFWLFMHKSQPEGISVLRIYRRRVFILLLFGITHVLLLWPGDILVFYALFGFLLILFRKVKDRTLIRWAVVFLLIPATLMAIMAGMIALAGFDPEAAKAIEASFAERSQLMRELIEQTIATYSNGSFSEIFFIRLREYSILLPGIFFFYPNVMAMFLVGQYAARKGFIQNAGSYLPYFKKLLTWGLIIGIPANLFYAYAMMSGSINEPGLMSVFAFLAMGFGGPALTLVYVSAIVLLREKGLLKRFSAWMAPVGRMALTNYLMHSLIAALLFHSYGLGLYGKVNMWQGILLTIAVFSIQIPFSIYWLRKYRFGPLEWLWRSLTYRKFISMKKSNEFSDTVTVKPLH